MKKTTEDFRNLHETEKDSIIKEQRLYIRILWAALIFSTLLMATNAFKLATMAYEVRMLTEKNEDPYYQGNTNIGGGINYDLQGNADIGNDITVDLGNSKSETVEGSQFATADRNRSPRQRVWFHQR